MVQKQANPKLIGSFILAAFFIFIAVFFMINKNRFFSHSIKYVLYFQGSIKGLNVGSPVVLNGVPIGRVIGISLITNMQTMELQTPVYIETNQNSFIVTNTHGRSKEDIQEFTDKLIAKGLRAKLESQSLLTGQMMVAMGFYPDTPVVLQKKQSKILEIPTLPSTSQEVLKTFQKLPLQETFANLNRVLTETMRLVQTVNSDSPKVMKNIVEISSNLADVSEKAEKALNSFNEDSRTMMDLNKMLRDFSSAAQSLRNWADYLERHPEALLRGKGGIR
ncbi:MAG: MCE family protein [Alphaproteobacteria bacterium]|nr:MCE family protein [Alphaproteobacteria bacterium]